MATKRDKRYDSQVPNDRTRPYGGAGIGAAINGVGSFGNDMNRNAGNLASTVGAFLSGNKDPVDGGGIGDFLFGSSNATENKRRKGLVDSAAATTTSWEDKYRRRKEEEAAAAPADDVTKDLSYWLDMAKSMQGDGGSGTDYSGMRRQLTGDADVADGKLAAAYQALVGRINGQGATIGQNFDEATQNVKANTDQAAAQIAAGYQKSRQGVTDQLATLGIQEAAGAAEANAPTADREAGGVAAATTNGLATQNQLQNNRATSQQFNTSMANASDMQGMEARYSLQQQLARKLAEITTAQSSERSQSMSPSALVSLASSLRGFDAEEGLSPEDQLAAMKYQSDNDYRTQKAASDQEASKRNYYAKMLDIFGGDETKAQKAFQVMYPKG